MNKKDWDAISELYLESIDKKRIPNADRSQKPPELKKFQGLFSVDPLENDDLMNNIGEWCVMKNWTPEKGTANLFPYKIMHLQKNYKGDVIYRVENQADNFGRPISPDEVRIIDVGEARKIWNYYRTRAVKDHIFDEFDPDFDKK